MSPEIQPVRFAPSGNDILINGQPAGVGPGAMIRMREGAKEGSQGITTVAAELLFDGTAGLRTTLPDPDSHLDYRVECEFDVVNQTSGTVVVTAVLRASFDNAATWTTLRTDVMTVRGVSQEHVHPRFVLGALTGLVGAPDSVIVDCLVSCSNDTLDVNGTVGRISISEHSPLTVH